MTVVALRRPALFRQIRVTGPGRQAEILKLRTLGQHGNPDTCWTVPPRQCTAFGRFLRVTHLDELPQLANVALGQMSLVGPRPGAAVFRRQFAQDDTRLRRPPADDGRPDRLGPGARAER